LTVCQPNFQSGQLATIYQLSATSADMNRRKTAKQKINNANPLVKNTLKKHSRKNNNIDLKNIYFKIIFKVRKIEINKKTLFK
jgi:hypothetical protein